MDSPSDSAPLKARDRILRRLAALGVAEEYLDRPYEGIVKFVMENRSWIPELVSAILPTDEEVLEFIQDLKARSKKLIMSPSMKNRFRESMVWLQWLMFEGEPSDALKNLAKMSVDQRGVCGAVWGVNDIAYRCRTCENDPTCAICVPCFQNGNHKDHDYSIIYTGGGCCDCGDETAWKRDGFCSKHKGADQIQPLSENLANSVGPVLDSLLICWKKKLLSGEAIFHENPRASDRGVERKKVANELTFVVVEMLLEFCKYSESLLSFVSRRVIVSAGLLEILVRAERFLSDVVVKKLHELLLKLLGEPVFKYEFAKVFLGYYPVVISDAIKEFNDSTLKKYPLISTFSVQIFTVPTLTPRLVKEMNLLEMLLGCLGDIFISCSGEDGSLKAVEWGNLYETTNRVIGDIRFVMSHDIVSKYATHDQRDVSRTWMKLLAFVQGMNPIKRETGLHLEEENESMHLLFVLGHSIANIHSLLVDGAFSFAGSEEMDALSDAYKQDMDDGDSLRHAKVGRLSQESSVCSITGRSSAFASMSNAAECKSDAMSHVLIPTSVTWLVYECLRAIENWLRVDAGTSATLRSVFSPNTSSISGSNFLALKKTFSKIRKGKYFFGRLRTSSEDLNVQSSSPVYAGIGSSGDTENVRNISPDSKTNFSAEIDTAACSSDVTAMEGDSCMELEAFRVLSLSDWPDIIYDVSSQDISVHIPLHRLLSLLLQKALRRCYDESVVPNIINSSSASPLSAVYADFFGHIFGSCHPFGFSGYVMEHPLRIRVFCAQVNAGMWRKNGDVALVSCEWYRSVRWSEQGLELDLFLLQCCAALAPPDLFVNRILERFGLSNYLSLSLERSSEYEPVLVQEMLTLIMQILQERRFCGLSTADSLKRELIYKLAIGDATHSQLVKSLPRDLSKFDKLQEILDRIAEYSNPSGFNQGMYSLRWAYWKELDLYHPRWNSRDLQIAEERYLRFCGVSALTTQLPRWTKIYPPLQGMARIATCRVTLQIIRAALFYVAFTDKVTESRAPDGILIIVLHLLSLALDICLQQKQFSGLECPIGDANDMLTFACEESCEGLSYGVGKQSLLSLLVASMRTHRKENLDNFLEAGSCSFPPLIESLLKKFAEIDSQCMIKLQQLAPKVVSHLSPSIPNNDMNTSGSASDMEKRKAKARERQAAILAKMKAEQSKFLSSISSNANDDLKSEEMCDSDLEHDSEDVTHDVCSLCHDSNSKSPVSFLIFLQKSRLLSFVDKGPPSWDRSDRLIDQSGAGTSSSGSALTSSQSVQLNENATNAFTNDGQLQQVEINTVLDFVHSSVPLMSVGAPYTSINGRVSGVCSFETLEEEMYTSICKEMHGNMLATDQELSADVSCQESSRDAESILMGKYISAISKKMTENPSASENAHSDRMAIESTSELPVYDGFGPVGCDGIYLSSCGHAVHQGCLERYLASLKERYVRRNIFEGAHIVDPDQGEFLCPVCRRLANSVLPAVHGNYQKASEQPVTKRVDSMPPIGPSCTSIKEIFSLQLQRALSLLQCAANLVGRPDVLDALPLQRRERTTQNLEPVSRVLSKMYFTKKQDRFLESPRLSHSIILWDTLKYSLMSVEIAARCRKTSMTPNYSLDSLYKEFKSSGGFISSLLLKVVQNMKSTNSVHVLQRFRGIQLFMQSICSGVSHNYHSGKGEQEGFLLSVLNHDDVEVLYPDMQFWNRASDPVLSRDPFSSLMWVLFCLPCPFISCDESILSHMHIFYAVSVVQAIITCSGKFCHKINELGFHDCLITDIYKLVGKSGSVQQYFVSNYVDPSSDIKDMIRQLTFPYLRRCALLWKLLNSSVPAPFSDKDNLWDVSSHAFSDMMDTTEGAPPERTEVQELENMFKIPPLDVVLNIEVLRSLALKWFRHFHKEYEVRSFQNVFHCNPAVPFKLMNLPHLYQDLLQRYIKQCCPDCKTPLDEPALCLLCGRLCSPSWKPCCRESGCLAHAMACGAGIGVFLLIRRTTILLQRCARQAPWPSPYLDAFGEEDIETHRGKPLYLNEERYAALNYMVASHGLDRSSKVLGQTTIGAFFMV